VQLSSTVGCRHLVSKRPIVGHPHLERREERMEGEEEGRGGGEGGGGGGGGEEEGGGGRRGGVDREQEIGEWGER